MSDERDAFGRKAGDDGLGDLGWGTTTPAPAQPPPAVVPRRSSAVGWFVAIVVLVAIAGGMIVALGASETANEGDADAVPAVTTTSESSQPPPQVQPLALLTPGGLRSAIEILERDVPGRLDSFRLAADRIDVIVVRGGQRTIAQVTPDAEVADKIAVQDNPIPLTDGLDYDQIDVGGPARLIRASNERVNRSRDDVDYLVWGFAGRPQWNLYYKGGVYTQGDEHGRYVRRLQ